MHYGAIYICITGHIYTMGHYIYALRGIYTLWGIIYMHYEAYIHCGALYKSITGSCLLRDRPDGGCDQFRRPGGSARLMMVVSFSACLLRDRPAAAR